MKQSESLVKIAPALIKMQGEIKGAIKDSTNPFFKASYADLESCWEAVRDALQKNDLAVIQTFGFIPTVGPSLHTLLIHSSGEWISGEQPLCMEEVNPQDLGSASTYARRYGLSAITGLIQVDDDANSASKNRNKIPALITEAQAGRLRAIGGSVKITQEAAKAILQSYGYASSDKVEKSKYEEICKKFEEWKPVSLAK